MKDLTIIIVSFNSAEIIEQCLKHLNFKKYDVVVVDNASNDNIDQIIVDKFPDARLIRNDKNLGYGHANNVALRQVKTEFSLILNPDAFLFEEDIEISLNILKENSQIALASPKVFRDEHHQESLKIDPFDKGYEFSNFIVGGVLFIRMEIFRRIGFFNEEFFMFAEDNELSDRSIKNGYKNAIITSAKAFHSGGGSSKKCLRVTYRRFWHLGWSKSNYKQIKKGKLRTIRATLRLSLIYFLESVFYLLVLNLNKSVAKFAFSAGCFSFLIGLKSFKKDGTPRG